MEAFLLVSLYHQKRGNLNKDGTKWTFPISPIYSTSIGKRLQQGPDSRERLEADTRPPTAGGRGSRR